MKRPPSGQRTFDRAPQLAAPSTPMFRLSSRLLVALILPFLANCGVGTAAVVASSGSDSGGGPEAFATATISALDSTEVSPARVEVTLKTNGPDQHLNLFLEFNSGPAQNEPLALVLGPADLTVAPANTTKNKLATAAGVVHEFYWDFSSQLGPELSQDVTVSVRSPSLPAASLAGVVVGNALATPVDLMFDGEQGGILVTCSVTDFGAQLYSVRPEVELTPGHWVAATPVVGSYDEDGFWTVPFTAPQPALFLWDSSAQLPGLSGNFGFRFFARDQFTEVVDGDLSGLAPAHVGTVKVINSVPIASLDQASLDGAGDGRGLVAVPYQLINVDPDGMRAIVQVAPPGEVLPDPPTEEELDQVLADAEQRAAYRIAVQVPVVADVECLATANPSVVRLPGLAAERAWFSAVPLDLDVGGGPLAGSRLRVDRPVGRFAAVDADWNAATVSSLVELLPVDEASEALVLLQQGGVGRIERVELASGTGTLLATLAGPGVALDAQGTALWVLSGAGSNYQLQTLNLSSGVLGPVLPFVSAAQLETVVVLGSSTVAVVGEGRIFSVSVAGGAAAAVEVAADLGSVRDAIRDPQDARRLLLARSAGGGLPAALISLHLDSGQVRVFDTPSGLNPISLAPAEIGNSLWVATAAGAVWKVPTPGGLPQLSQATEAYSGLPSGLRRLRASGPNGLVVFKPSGPSRVLAAGGTALVRTVQQANYETQFVTLTKEVPDTLRTEIGSGGRPARLQAPTLEQRVRVVDGRSIFLVDVEELWPKGSAELRLVPYGTQVQGVAATAQIETASPFVAPANPLILPLDNFHGHFVALATPDLDGDVQPDLVFARASNGALGAARSRGDGTFHLPFFYSPGMGQDSLASTVLQVRGGVFEQRDETVALFSGSAAAAGTSRVDVLRWIPAQGQEAERFDLQQRLELPFQASDVATANLDRGTCLDLLVLDPDGDRLEHFAGTCQELAPFAETVSNSIDLLPLAAGSGRMAVADFDLDGARDVVVVGTGRIQWVKGTLLDGGALWAPASLAVTDVSLAGSMVRVEICDGDGDGRPDVAVTFADGAAQAFVFRFDVGTQQFVELTRHGPSLPSSLAAVRVADVDGDGRADLNLRALGATTGLRTHRQPDLEGDSVADLQFGSGPTAQLPAQVPEDLALADFDGNGATDAITGFFGDGGGQAILAMSTQSVAQDLEWTSLVSWAGLVDASRSTLADVDGDLLLDLVGAARTDITRIEVYRQTAPGQFSSSPVFPIQLPSVKTVLGLAALEAEELSVVDLTGDGRADLLVKVQAVTFEPTPGQSIFCCQDMSIYNSLTGAEVLEESFLLYPGRAQGGFDTGAVQSLGRIPHSADITQAFPVAPTSPGQVTIGNHIRGYRLLDFDGDQDLDLLVFYLRPERRLFCGGETTLVHIVSAADLGPAYASAVALFRNPDDGSTFPAEPELLIDFEQGTGRRYGSLDVDANGLPDLLEVPLTFSPAGCAFVVGTVALRFHFNTGSAAQPFGAEAQLVVNFPGAETLFEFDADVDIKLLDLDLDGQRDLVLPGRASHFHVLASDQLVPGTVPGTAWLSVPIDPQGAVTGQEVRVAEVGDVDGDGLPDLMIDLVGGVTQPGSVMVESAVLRRTGLALDDFEILPWIAADLGLALGFYAVRLVDVNQDRTFEVRGFETEEDGFVVGRDR
jgi:hypothetical protein